MKKIEVFQVNAFTDKPFGGNPAGVVLDATTLSDEQMQNIAREMNLSETAFVTGVKHDFYDIRFFTPVCEVDLCGHATIATFHTLAKEGYIEKINNGTKTIYQNTKAGKLSVDIVFNNGEVDNIIMEQTIPQDIEIVEDIHLLCQALGIEVKDVGVLDRMIFPEIISTGLPDIILPIKDKKVLDNLTIDLKALAKLSERLEVIGVHAFHLPKIDSDIVYTRNFAPLVGIDEEAATGTSNGALIYYLKKNKLIKHNEIVSYQGESMDRPSKIYCKIEETKETRIKVGGKATIVLKKNILLNQP